MHVQSNICVHIKVGQYDVLSVGTFKGMASRIYYEV